jgi:hypothetical protein
MTDPTAVVVREQEGIFQRVRETPAEAVAKAREQAQELMKIVKETRISKRIGDKEHLQVEAWQTIARFNRCWIDTDWTRDIKDSEGRVLGVEARARLIRLDDGVVLGGAEGACMMDEELERQDGTVIERWTDYYAVKSMAQTRAQGKVGRMAFAWVAVLGGYAGTPAEEMGGVGGPRVPFGRDKGRFVSELTDPKDISWLADAIAKSITDPEKARFKGQNERLHAALVTRLNELSAPPPAPHPPVQEASPPGPPAAGGAADAWRSKFEAEVLARGDEFDKKGTVLQKLLEDAGLFDLGRIQTRDKAVEFFQEYIKRTGKPTKQGGLL